MADVIYWTMRNGQKISIDDMDINHLRNTLKMIVRNTNKKQASPTLTRSKPIININGELAQEIADKYDIGITTGIWCDCDYEQYDDSYPCQHCMGFVD